MPIIQSFIPLPVANYIYLVLLLAALTGVIVLDDTIVTG